MKYNIEFWIRANDTFWCVRKFPLGIGSSGPIVEVASGTASDAGTAMDQAQQAMLADMGQ